MSSFFQANIKNIAKNIYKAPHIVLRYQWPEEKDTLIYEWMDRWMDGLID